MYYFIVFDIAADTRLGLNLDIVSYGKVSCDPHLSAYATMFTYFARTSNSRLGGNHCVSANLHIVSDLYKVVNLDSLADNGGAHGGTVNSSIGTKFHIVF